MKMEMIAEQVVQAFLVQGGEVFVSPGYNIAKNGKEWSCPDFVALDFGKREVVVVEVTTAYDIESLIQKVENRREQWFVPLRAQLDADKIAEGWKMRFLGFVRKERLERAKRDFIGMPEVTFTTIEESAFSWEYWDRRKGELPRSDD
jgi:hypothetical protein